MTGSATGDAGEFRPWRLRGRDPLDARRRQLFAIAAPVFRVHGFRGSSVKGLAHACGLKPASLYHYFGSKEEMATYLVRQPRMDWDSTWVDPAIEPLVQLRLLIDLALDELPNYLLALRLADEITGSGTRDGAHTRAFREGESVFGRLLVAAAPAMTRRDAERAARGALSAMVGSAVIGLDSQPGSEVRERVVALLRTDLVPTHVGARRYDAAMLSTEKNG